MPKRELEAAYLEHEKLMEVYDWLQAAAKEKRGHVSRAFYECGQGRGTGPTMEQLAEAEHLEKQVSDQWAIVVAHLDATFGGGDAVNNG